jgi:hypothetical protein
VKNLIKIAICGLVLLTGASYIHAGHHQLVYVGGPTDPKHNYLNVIYNTKLSKPEVAVFDVVANNPEYKIHGCILDIKLRPARVKLVPVPEDKTNSSVFGYVSTAGFGEELGRAIGVMDQDGRCRMATAIRAKDGDPKFALPAQGVLMRFAIGLTDTPCKELMKPTINARNCGLVDANDKIIPQSLVCTSMGSLEIK